MQLSRLLAQCFCTGKGSERNYNRAVQLDASVVKLEAATDASVKIEDPKAQAIAYRDDVFAQFVEVREPADKLETLVDEKAWPFPTYAELLFNV